MAVLMRETSLKTTLKAKVNTDGLMVECTRDTGLIIRCTASELLHGLMAGGTKDHIIMTKKRDWARFSGLIKEYMKEVGWMENSMEWDTIPRDLISRRDKENGKKERG